MINVMIAGNEKVIDGMIIETLSLIKHCDKPINLFILTMDLSFLNKYYKPIQKSQIKLLEDILKRGNEESKVTLIDYTSYYLEEMKNSPNSKNRYTPYALLRLYSDSMKEIPDKILYLDTDIVFNDSIEKLYSINIEKYELAGSLDYYGHIFINKNYLNSGVLLLNMKLIRETKMFKKSRDMVATKKMLLCDQDAINKTATKKLILPYKFNEQHSIKKDTVIRHFSKTIKWFPYFNTQNIKPWHVEKVRKVLKINQFDDILDEYLRVKGELTHD